MAGEILVLLPLYLVGAALYSSVGHGGASFYLAAGALAGLQREALTPIALSLNLLVAGLAFWNYWRAGPFSLRLLLPFIVTSIPAAYWGGSLSISPQVFAGLLGFTLLLAAARLLLFGREMRPRLELDLGILWLVGLPAGLALGFLSGLIGVGGGIFLSPILLLLGWADAKRTAAISSAFIVLNSLSGLVGHLVRGAGPQLEMLLPLLGAVAIGGAIGSYWGAQRIRHVALQRLLGAVLLVAAFKLLQQFMSG